MLLLCEFTKKSRDLKFFLEMLKATLRLPDEKIENFEISTGELLSNSIDEMRTKVNDRLTELCNIEKAKKGQPAEKKQKLEEGEDEEIEE